MDEKIEIAIERKILAVACHNFLREGEGICVSFGEEEGLNFIVNATKNGVAITPTTEVYKNGHMLWMKDLKPERPKGEVIKEDEYKSGRKIKPITEGKTKGNIKNSTPSPKPNISPKPQPRRRK